MKKDPIKILEIKKGEMSQELLVFFNSIPTDFRKRTLFLGRVGEGKGFLVRHALPSHFKFQKRENQN